MGSHVGGNYRSEGRQRPMWHAKNINKDIIIIRLGFNTRKRKAMEVISFVYIANCRDW